MINENAILREIANLKEFFEREFSNNKAEHNEIKKSLRAFYDEHEGRIRKIEDWRLVFVTKYSIYSAIALFLGSIVSTLGYQIIIKYI